MPLTNLDFLKQAKSAATSPPAAPVPGVPANLEKIASRSD